MVAVSIFMTGCHKKSLGGENTMGTLFAFVKTGFKQSSKYNNSCKAPEKQRLCNFKKQKTAKRKGTSK